MPDDFNLPQSPRTTVILSWLAWILILISGALTTAGGYLLLWSTAATAALVLLFATVLAGVSSEIRRRIPSAERIGAIDPPAGPTVRP
jgi:uncharacterized SAM-binding protein YcdF (DUF218 family)